MLGSKDASATIAVRNTSVARQFYENTIGLKVIDTEGAEAVVYKSGSSRILVYQSEYAGTNKATAATWVVGNDLESVVQDLKARGVVFEHYALPGMTREGDVHVADGMKAAWFKDPDGNILAMVSR